MPPHYCNYATTYGVITATKLQHMPLRFLTNAATTTWHFPPVTPRQSHDSAATGTQPGHHRMPQQSHHTLYPRGDPASLVPRLRLASFHGVGSGSKHRFYIICYSLCQELFVGARGRMATLRWHSMRVYLLRSNAARDFGHSS